MIKAKAKIYTDCLSRYKCNTGRKAVKWSCHQTAVSPTGQESVLCAKLMSAYLVPESPQTLSVNRERPGLWLQSSLAVCHRRTNKVEEAQAQPHRKETGDGGKKGSWLARGPQHTEDDVLMA